MSSPSTESDKPPASDLVRRFSARVAPERRGELREIARSIVDGHPGESLDALAGRLAARLPAASFAFDEAASPDGPPLLRLDRRLQALPVLRPFAPRELLDGRPLQRSPGPLDYPTVLAWWREHLARVEAGRAPSLLQLYAHVPYCAGRCRFCHCDSIVLRNAADLEAYLTEILGEARAFARDLGPLDVQAATVGGGTPSLLDEKSLRRLLAALVGPVFRPTPDCFFSVELNPDTTTGGKLSILVEAGVNRVSFGVQSLHAPTLRAVGRGDQSAAQVEEAFALAHRHPALQLGLDLLAPLPEETESSFCDGARRAFELLPDQIVLYRYQPVSRRGAPFAAGSLPWEVASEFLLEEGANRGYSREEHGGPSVVLNRVGARRFSHHYHQHSLEPSSLLGLGPFAESRVFGFGEYRRAGPGGGPTPYFGCRLPMAAQVSSWVRRRLIERTPIAGAAFCAAFGSSLEAHWPAELAFLEDQGALARDGAGLRSQLLDEEEAFRASWLLLDAPSAGEVRRRWLAANSLFPTENNHVPWLTRCAEAAGRAGAAGPLAAALQAEEGAPLRLREASAIALPALSGDGGAPAFALRLEADLVLEEALPSDDDRELASTLLRFADRLRARPSRSKDARMAKQVARLIASGASRSVRVAAVALPSGERQLELCLDLRGAGKTALGALLHAIGAGDSCVPSAAAWDAVEEAVIVMGGDDGPMARPRWRIHPQRNSHFGALARRHRALAAFLGAARRVQLETSTDSADPVRLRFDGFSGARAGDVRPLLAAAASSSATGRTPSPPAPLPLPGLLAAAALVAVELRCGTHGPSPGSAELTFRESPTRAL